jgi:hypothetical protein
MTALPARGDRQHIVTFKADDSLIAAMDGIPNRSAFIRAAILAALDSGCPLCHGTGVLNPNQRRHWEEFAARHRVVACADCAEPQMVCPGAAAEAAGSVHS